MPGETTKTCARVGAALSSGSLEIGRIPQHYIAAQEFDRIWFLPTSSYLYKFFMVEKEYYPEAGEKGAIFFGKLNYTQVKMSDLSKR